METTFSRGANITYFALGGILLIVPLVLVLVWGSPTCVQQPTRFPCISSTAFKTVSAFLPFVMIVGGVLIGYRMKKISDALTPPQEPDDEPTGSTFGSR